MKSAGEVVSSFVEELERKQREREAQEKAEWEALPEEERQAILDERERRLKEMEARQKSEQHEKQIANWKRR
jgi:predicted Fe-S protein YdhL (DUF1289 family)